MAKSHYIPRFLTEPWEYDERRLLYYDFKGSRFRNSSSKTMLATPGLYTPELEQFLSDKIESDVGKFRQAVLKDKSTVDLKNWKSFRALHLLVMLQAQRFSSRNSSASKKDLEELVKKGDEYLDTLISAHIQENSLYVIKVTEYGRLCFPETGLFPFAVRDKVCVSGYSWCFGIPLHPEFFIVSCSKTVDESELNSLRKTPNLFMGHSVGTSKNAHRVIVPKALVELNGKDKMKDMIVKWQSLADDHVKIINKLRDNVITMWEMSGIPLCPIPGNLGSVLRPMSLTQRSTTV